MILGGRQVSLELATPAKARTAHDVAAGKITLIRLPRTPGEAKPYKPGRTLSVQTRPAQKTLCRVTIQTVTATTVGDLTFEQARAAGYRTREDAHAAWQLRYSHDDGLDPDEPVWTVTFEVETSDRLRWLAAASQYRYTQSRHRAFEPDAPAVDEDTLEWITDEARARHPVGQPKAKPPAEPGLVERVEQALRTELAERFRGEHPDDIAAASPKQGTPGEIRHRRRQMGLRAVDGLYPVPPDQIDELVASMAEEGCSVRDVALAVDCSVGKAQKLLARHRRQEAA